jgi:hypothetical protein
VSFKKKGKSSIWVESRNRTRQSHSLFSLRSRRRYSQRSPYFLCQRQSLLTRKPEWMGGSSTGLNW